MSFRAIRTLSYAGRIRSMLSSFRMVYFMDKKSRNNALIAHAIEENVSRFF